MDKDIKMEGVREYAEQMDVHYAHDVGGRPVIRAWNEGGHNTTEVDVQDMLEWLKANNLPEGFWK